MISARIFQVLLLAAGLATSSACGSSQTQPTTPERVVEMDEMRITAKRGQGGYEFEAYDASDLFERATELLNGKQCREAVALYDRLEREFPSSRYASSALYNAGLCLQALGDFAVSAEHFAAVRERHAASEDVRDASFQLAEVLVQLERWADVLKVSDELLAREELSADERLEGMARRGQGLLGAGRLEEAEQYSRGALSYFRTRSGDEVIRDEFFAAASSYVLAESFRLRAQAMAFPEGTEAQKQVLLARAQFLLEAQREYFNTIQFQNLDNLYWAAASGYCIGQMYDEFWHAIMNAPVPPELPPEGHSVYREELAKFVKPLIRHAIRYWELTLMLIERTGIKSAWATQTKSDLERVRALMAEQPPGPGDSTTRPKSAPPNQTHRRPAPPGGAATPSPPPAGPTAPAAASGVGAEPARRKRLQTDQPTLVQVPSVE